MMSILPDDPRVDVIPFEGSDGIRLFFRRGRRNPDSRPDRPPVLILHGGGASCDTFLEPAGISLFDFLSNQGMDVWLLEWSSSHYIADCQPHQANRTLDEAARVDIAGSVEFIHDHTGSPKVAILGHCLGAACLSMAIGGGHLKADRIHKIVLASIGLFYEVAWDGLAKTQDRLLDRMAMRNPPLAISPDVGSQPWPPMLEELFDLWPKTWGPSWRDDFFHRLAFLFGQPFLPSNLHPRMTPEIVRRQFGSIPFTLYQHAGQNALRGFAGRFDAEGKLNPSTSNDQIRSSVAADYVRPDRFRGIPITLLTGGENPLWHRDSVDRMAEWLARLGPRPPKYVLPDYGHQDLWWGPRSWDEVFPLVHGALS